jgi:hypothetical protein
MYPISAEITDAYTLASGVQITTAYKDFLKEVLAGSQEQSYGREHDIPRKWDFFAQGDQPFLLVVSLGCRVLDGLLT